jgi:hypothetical protein
MPKAIVICGDVDPDATDSDYAKALDALAAALGAPAGTDPTELIEHAVSRLVGGRIIDCWQLNDLPDGSVVLPCRADGTPFALPDSWPAGSEPFRTGTPQAASMISPYPDAFYLLLLTGTGPSSEIPVRVGDTFLGRDLPTLLPGTLWTTCDESGRPQALAVVYDVPEFNYRPAAVNDDTRCVVIAPPDGGA